MSLVNQCIIKHKMSLRVLALPPERPQPRLAVRETDPRTKQVQRPDTSYRPYLRNLRLEAIDMNALQPFVRHRKTKDEVANATINRALEVVRRVLNVVH